MSDINMTGSNLPLADVAASVVHAMNNLLASLYGAASYLEAAEHTPGIARASTAVASASATGQALSSALYLLSLTEGDGKALNTREMGIYLLDESEQEHLFDALFEVANVGCPEPMANITRKVRLDPDILKALLVCAAFCMRREAGPREPVHCTVQLEQGVASDSPALVFELGAPLLAEKAASATLNVRAAHPCATAMEHLGAMLPADCASLHRETAGLTRLQIRFIP